MFKFVRFLIGYVVISVSGENVELLINILLRRKISVWHIKRNSPGNVIFTMHADDFVRNIRSSARKAGCEVKILKKRGIHFTYVRYRHRKTLVISGLVAIILIMLSGMTVWDIDIVCDDPLVAISAGQRLNEMGIKEGSLINTIDTKEAARELLVSDNTLSWVNIEKRGTILKVNLKLTEEHSKIIHEVDESKACNIVALKDCVIYKVNLKAGNLLVSEGDTVTAGQVLVRGIGYENEFNNPDKGYEYESFDLHAKAQVLGIVWYSAEAEIAQNVTVMERTGNMNVSKSLVLFGRKIPIPSMKDEYERSDAVYYEKYLPFYGGKKLPVGIATDIEYETILSEENLSYDQAVMYAKMFAQTEIDNMIPADSKIINTNVEYIEKNGKEYIEIKVACLENVGVDLA